MFRMAVRLMLKISFMLSMHKYRQKTKHAKNRKHAKMLTWFALVIN